MKYLFIAAVIAAAACTVPPQSPPPQAPAPIAVLPEIEVRAMKEMPRKAAPKAHKSPCAGIDVGDEKENVRARLDCLTGLR